MVAPASVLAVRIELVMLVAAVVAVVVVVVRGLRRCY
jgi:hypothetical protein